jgi:glutamate decarboxylase
MPKNCEDLVVARIVVKEGFSHDMADMLLGDMRRTLDYFASQPAHHARSKGSHFHH